MKKIITLIFTIILFITSCNLKPTNINTYSKEDFEINKDFKVTDFEQNDNKIFLTLKSEKDITLYLKKLNESFDNSSLLFEISLFHDNANSTEFSIENLENFREFISYSLNDLSYISKKYIELPIIDESNYLSEFINENVQEKNDEIIINITMNLENQTISNMVGQLKTYYKFVREMNEIDKKIILNVNDKYIYENENYLIEKNIEKL